MISTLVKSRLGVVHSAAMSDAPSRAGEVAGEVAAAWMQLPGGVVNDSEIVILAIKPSMLRPLIDSFPWMVVTTVIASAMAWTGATFGSLSSATSVQLVLLIGVARFIFAVVRWAPSWYVLTNRRILTIEGVRKPRIASCPLLDIRNTYVDSDLIERLTQLGSVRFVSDKPSQKTQTWRSIAQPIEVHRQIRRAIENAIDQHSM